MVSHNVMTSVSFIIYNNHVRKVFSKSFGEKLWYIKTFKTYTTFEGIATFVMIYVFDEMLFLLKNQLNAISVNFLEQK